MEKTACVFKLHGSTCATRPWEVIFSLVTITIAMVSCVDWYKDVKNKTIQKEFHGFDVIFMTSLRVGALLYRFIEIRRLHDLGSKYVLGIVGLSTFFSSFVFSCAVLNILDCEFADLKDALFFFLLLIDLKKASYLVQLALASSSYEEAQQNIAEGLSFLGPSFTLDTIAGTLFIQSLALSGVQRIEEMCGFAVLSILVNYITLLTFYPSYLSLIIELSSRSSSGNPPWQVSKVPVKYYENIRSNPIYQGVQIIMSVALFFFHFGVMAQRAFPSLVHGITRWSFKMGDHVFEGSKEEIKHEAHFIIRLVTSNSEWITVMVILFVCLNFLWLDSTSTKEEQLLNIYQRKRSLCQEMVDVSVQTNSINVQVNDTKEEDDMRPEIHSFEECIKLLKANRCSELNDNEILELVQKREIHSRNLEDTIKDLLRAVIIRRKITSSQLLSRNALDRIPYIGYDYSKIKGQCCENVIGFTPVPLGIAGPLKVNGREYMIPMSTTEGALVASTSRGCKALSQSEKGVTAQIFRDGMTRAPILEFSDITELREVYEWIENQSNYAILKEAFENTSRFAKLKHIHVKPVSYTLHLRFEAETGDAMGMNMVSKGVNAALIKLKSFFPRMKEVCISGNLCTDKKPSAVNWYEGRGKSIICEAYIPENIVQSVLKTTAQRLVNTNIHKNFKGSAMAGSIGGNNGHAANIVSAMFLACGQDIAQVVGSSSCLTDIKTAGPTNSDVYITVTMPVLEVGTVGGGTMLPAQAGCLQMLGIEGPSKEIPGENARQLGRIIASAVMAGELSLLASLTEGTLVKSHLSLNRN